MTRNQAPVRTGRTNRCTQCRSSVFCASCQQRIRYGDPVSSDSWASRLSLTEDQMNLLLVGAAEFVKLHAEFSKRAKERGLPEPSMPTPIAFLDWIAPDVVGDKPQSLDYDGIHLNPGVVERHPDPLPYAPRPFRRAG